MAVRNQVAINTARNNIEKYRKGAIRIKAIDQHGLPLRNIRLDVKQISHKFKFGCYVKIDDLDPVKLPDYESHLSALFNYAVIGTYWDNTENRQDDENWKWFDREVELSSKLGLDIQAAPILWGTSKYGTPDWLPQQQDELLATLKKRVRSTVTRNANISDNEIVNEPLAPSDDMFARVAGNEYIATAFYSAMEADPKKRRMINEYGVFGAVEKHNYNDRRYFNLLERLIKKGVPIDIIGIQAHANGEWFEPANVAAELDRYATLGKPIQISEFSAQTLEFDDRKTPLSITGKYHSGIWDDEKQAEFYREFYTIAFGSPQVEAITTWGLDDDRAWLPGIGLINKNGHPKPVFSELDRLINKEWKTRSASLSNAEGFYNLRGFYGNYEVTATSRNGKIVRSTFTLTNQKTDAWVIKLKI